MRSDLLCEDQAFSTTVDVKKSESQTVFLPTRKALFLKTAPESHSEEVQLGTVTEPFRKGKVQERERSTCPFLVELYFSIVTYFQSVTLHASSQPARVDSSKPSRALLSGEEALRFIAPVPRLELAALRPW